MAEEETPEKKSTAQFYVNLGFLVMGGLGVYMLIALYLMITWDTFAHDMHLPQLTVSGALGLLGLVVFALAAVIAAYLVAFKDWGD